MDNIEILLNKIKENKLAYVLINSLKDIPTDNWSQVLEEVINNLLQERINSYSEKSTDNDN